jgi:hypothetical protein
MSYGRLLNTTTGLLIQAARAINYAAAKGGGLTDAVARNGVVRVK